VSTSSDWPLGAAWSNKSSCSFLVWAPSAKTVDVHVLSPTENIVPMQRLNRGYFLACLDNLLPGAFYRYRLNGETERPDPASRFQPEGVHGPSQVIDPSFGWTDQDWRGIPLDQFVIYELHAGTFTPEGTFDAIIPRISGLRELGITAIEIMPVAQFPGNRNWGYDGVYPFAVQDSYGGPAALKRLVNGCHANGIAVVLDVVYNHLGPEGNYLADFGPYFTDYYRTPWGAAINFEQAHSDEVRRYFIDNALHWVSDFHIDGLRLDAIHAIVDPSASTFVQELAAACHNKAEELNRKVHVIAESSRNDNRVVTSCEAGGWGLDAEWNDDFHHSLRVLLTGEREGYYADFGEIGQLSKAFREGFVFTGQYSNFRQKHYGNSSRELPGNRLVVFAQNHDQVGNRKTGDRLSNAVGFERAKLAAGTVLLSPYVPLLFMGEEYGEAAPFQYFVSHGDPALVDAVRRGRSEEFADFDWVGDLPDPQDEETFLRSKLNWDSRAEGQHRMLWNLYRELLRLRREIPALAQLDKNSLEVGELSDPKALVVRRWTKSSQALIVLHFGAGSARISLPSQAGLWEKLLDSSDPKWGGSEPQAPDVVTLENGAAISVRPCSFLLFRQT
jgi:maltooligosyltrehalose trehalohydrolase